VTRYPFHLAGFAVVLSLAGCAATDDGGDAPAQARIVDVAADGAAGWLAKIPWGSERGFGFDSRDELDRARVATPVRMATVSERTGAIELMETWRVPVVVDGEARALLTVERRGGQSRVVDLGAAALALELDDMARRHRVEETGARLVLLRLFRERSDLVVIVPRGARVEDGAIYPLRSAARFLHLPLDEALPLSRVTAARRAR
jgi:hypothetical protein